MLVDPKLIPPTHLEKAFWESSNEGVHERVNFDDTIWGFDLAGGVKYNKPLTVTTVRDDSRAQKAGIRAGDTLTKINDVATETLSLREAHDMIIESGIHLRLAVTAPEDLETTYSYWEDKVDPEEEAARLRAEEAKKIKYFVCKTRSDWDLQWPWVSLKKTIYKASNCYLVPSKFESKFGHKLLPVVKEGPIVLESIKSKKENDPDNNEEGASKNDETKVEINEKNEIVEKKADLLAKVEVNREKSDDKKEIIEKIGEVIDDTKDGDDQKENIETIGEIINDLKDSDDKIENIEKIGEIVDDLKDGIEEENDIKEQRVENKDITEEESTNQGKNDESSEENAEIEEQSMENFEGEMENQDKVNENEDSLTDTVEDTEKSDNQGVENDDVNIEDETAEEDTEVVSEDPLHENESLENEEEPGAVEKDTQDKDESPENKNEAVEEDVSPKEETAESEEIKIKVTEHE